MDDPKHECIRYFGTRRIDECCGEGHNKCYGEGPMFLDVWFMDTNGHEEYYDNWMEIDVNFCPYCGLKAIK
jgi:hypothetical protein